MRNLELDITKIAEIEKQKERENLRFRAFLKGQDSERIDEIVHRLDKEITVQINCQDCGNCCTILRPNITEQEIATLSHLKNLSPTDFESHFVEKVSFENAKCLKYAPCIFLKDKNCSIYTDRPEDCKSFPHTHKDDFTARLFVMIENYGICPIVFNVFEGLKIELGFK